MASESPTAVWMPAAPKPGAMSFAILFAVESFARAVVSAVVSVQAYDLLKSGQHVSLLFTTVGLFVPLGTLLVPLLHHFMPRRWVYTTGVLLLIAASLCFASFTLVGQAAGMYLRVLGTAVLNITLSLYILDHIRRADLVRSEPLRLTFSVVSWTAGPYLGIWLYANYGHAAPQIASIIGAFVLLIIFWYLRLSTNPAIKAGPARPVSPWASVGRFVAQPRLRLAWLIAFGRSCFWSSFFIYAPLLMIEGGLGKEAGGLLLSAGNAVLILAIVFGRIAERTSVRQVIVASFAVGAVASIAAGLAGTGAPLLAAFLLLIGSIAASSLDGVGGIPFMRAVKGRERAAMTGVYRTYIDFSDLIPSFVFSIALGFFGLGVVFIILGFWLAIVGLTAWIYLPRSM
ncbi:MAG: MFS transporter [Rhizobiales bacterium]|nr:MFS transporter [Hyphomicrobiales bacterium]